MSGVIFSDILHVGSQQGHGCGPSEGSNLLSIKRLLKYVQCFFGPCCIYCRKYLWGLHILSYSKGKHL